MAKIFTHLVSFGDCDPAGIAYYPNMFSWMDKAFHLSLAPHGGHPKICSDLGTVGFGLASASAEFSRPIGDMDALDIHIDDMAWTSKTLTLEYSGRIKDEVHFTGKEVRCMFVASENGISAGPIGLLKEMLE
ncbi:acyl-CoA thioesterase [Phaeobacter sp. C3_T13_0]|uniref:acyl-CoA thioesterase n=1 Tax=Phaeobacter cretensis TaxID=3342641 RepID=UPI0039BD1BC1